MYQGFTRWSSFQRGYFENSPNTIVYLTFTLTLETPNLIIPPYSEYQQFLYETISDLRDKGLTFDQIADWLNENGYSTPRGKKFRNAHAHSIIKKKRIRDERLNQECVSHLSKFELEFEETNSYYFAVIALF